MRNPTNQYFLGGWWKRVDILGQGIAHKKSSPSIRVEISVRGEEK